MENSETTPLFYNKKKCETVDSQTNYFRTTPSSQFAIFFGIVIFVICHISGIVFFLFIEAGPEELSKLICDVVESEIIFNEHKYLRCLLLTTGFLPIVLFYICCFFYWLISLLNSLESKKTERTLFYLTAAQKRIRWIEIFLFIVALICPDYSIIERWHRTKQISWFLFAEWIARNIAFVFGLIEIIIQFYFKQKPSAFFRIFILEYTILPNVWWHTKYSTLDISHAIFCGAMIILSFLLIIGWISTTIEVPYSLEQQVEHAVSEKKKEINPLLTQKCQNLIVEVTQKIQFLENQNIKDEDQLKQELNKWKEAQARLNGILSEARAQVSNDHQAKNSLELTVMKGDSFTILGENGDFYFGITNGKKGLVPKININRITQDTFADIRMMRYFLNWRTLLVAFFGSLSGASYSVSVFLLSQLITGNSNLSIIGWKVKIIWLIILALSSVAIFSAIEKKIRKKAKKFIEYSLRLATSKKSIDLDTKTIHQIDSLKLQEFVLDAPSKFGSSVKFLGQMCLPIGSAILCIISLFVLDVRMAVMTMSIIAAVSLFIFARIFMIKPRLSRKKQRKSNVLRSECKELVDEREQIRNLQIHESKFEEIDRLQKEENEEVMKRSNIEALLNFVEWILLGFITISGLLFADFLIEHKLFGTEEKSAYALLNLNLIWDIYAIITALKLFFDKYSSGTQIADFLRLPVDLSLNGFGHDERKEEISLKNYTIDFKDVSLVIQGKNLSCKFPDRSSIGIVGQSGCGKSTLFGLLLRILKPTTGVITIGGVDISNFSISQLYRIIRIIPQRSSVFRGSVMKNLELGIKDKYLLERQEVANVLEGIDCNQECSTLSGGQQQRICSLRGILSGANILLLDEATSALDIETESSVVKLLHTIQREENCTVVNIAHRLNIMKKADKIIVLRCVRNTNKDSIMEMGNHSSLKAKNGWYQTQLSLLG